MTSERLCDWCGRPLEGRRNQRFCDRNCKRSALRARRRREERSNYLASIAAPSESRDTDAWFHAMLAVDARSRIPHAQAAEWDAYERRHGTEHPGRTADRIQRQAAERAARTPRFTTPTIAERGMAERHRAPLRVHHAGPGRDDNDPDMMEPPHMIDAGNWRSGRKW
jgi:hypothetical protein